MMPDLHRSRSGTELISASAHAVPIASRPVTGEARGGRSSIRRYRCGVGGSWQLTDGVHIWSFWCRSATAWRRAEPVPVATGCVLAGGGECRVPGIGQADFGQAEDGLASPCLAGAAQPHAGPPEGGVPGERGEAGQVKVAHVQEDGLFQGRSGEQRGESRRPFMIFRCTRRRLDSRGSGGSSVTCLRAWRNSSSRGGRSATGLRSDRPRTIQICRYSRLVRAGSRPRSRVPPSLRSSPRSPVSGSARTGLPWSPTAGSATAVRTARRARPGL
jgi:hypothetical protein